ncbi:UNVERIFIED_CONTAM: hypothetical protein GTU68_025285, partial [Idotea baltica]|nr:hypothetical protein [Idotea baltica]
ISISELLFQINSSLQSLFPNIYFQGEISELTRAASGHIYLTIKDKESQIRSVIWRGTAERFSFKPEVGLSVLCTGKTSIYPRSGSFQIVVSTMKVAGEGDLQKKFLELQSKLKSEGLFDEERKRKIPFLPKAIGIVTSDSGAAIHDMKSKISERMPNAKIYLMDVRVQGVGSIDEITWGIKELNKIDEVDIIIVARGGGSLEDLWSFNEEKVVRAIFSSRKPVISGVGHESDTTLSDLVADRRATTPTAAAEIVVPNIYNLTDILDSYLSKIFNKELLFARKWQAVDDYDLRINNIINSFNDKFKSKVKILDKYLKILNPIKDIRNLKTEVNTFDKDLNRILRNKLKDNKKILDFNLKRLELINHDKVLKRGYSVIKKDSKVITNISNIKKDETLDIDFYKGNAKVKVLNKKK